MKQKTVKNVLRKMAKWKIPFDHITFVF